MRMGTEKVLCTGLGGGRFGFIRRVGRAGRGGGAALEAALLGGLS